MSSRIDELEKSLEKVLAQEDSAESGKSWYLRFFMDTQVVP